MRDVAIWVWGAFTTFGAAATYELFTSGSIKGLVNFNTDFAVTLIIFAAGAALIAFIAFLCKIGEHWNCKKE